MFRRWGWNALKWGSDTLRERIRHYWICLSYQNANVNFFARAVSSKGEASKWHSRSSKIVSLRLRWMKSWQRWKVMWVSFNHQAITFLGLSLLILWLQPDSDWSVIYVSLFHVPTIYPVCFTFRLSLWKREPTLVAIHHGYDLKLSLALSPSCLHMAIFIGDYL